MTPFVLSALPFIKATNISYMYSWSDFLLNWQPCIGCCLLFHLFSIEEFFYMNLIWALLM